MELDDLRHAWTVLDRRLARQEARQLHVFRRERLSGMQRALRPLCWGQWLQIAFGLALALLGARVWTTQYEAPLLLATGLVVHAYGIATIACAGVVLASMARIDNTAPVLEIQQRMARLRRTYWYAANVVGLPWWLLWVLVVVACVGVGGADLFAHAPGWTWGSLGVGVVGLVATLGWQRRRLRRAPGSDMHDCGSLARAQHILDEIAAFEAD